MGSVDLVSDGFERAANQLAQDITSNTHRLETCVEQFRVSVDKLVNAIGMQAENDQRKVLGHSMAYDESAFANL